LLKNDFPDIEAVTRLLQETNLPVRYGDKKFNETQSFLADENFPKIFDLDMVEGEASALKDPYMALLSETEAHKYFGNEDPVGKAIKVDDHFDVKVAGVYKSFPSTAHMHPELLLSFSTLNNPLIYGEEGLRTNWGNNAFSTYLLVPAHYPVEKIQAQFPAFLDKHMPAGYYGGAHPSTMTSLELMKLTDIHLHSHLDDELEENGDINKVYIFGAIALFILLIACINYMNLSTARSSIRAREIGIRKTIGALRKELIFQFLSESVAITVLAMLISLLLTALLLPYMSSISGRALSFSVLGRPAVWVPLTLLPFFVGAISGLYPALFLSSFRPVLVLKGIFKAGGADISFRKALVVLQFAISIVLIICTAVVFQQVKYIHNKPLGYDKDHLVVVRYQAELDGKFDAFRNQLLSDNRILDAAVSSRIPTGRLLDEQDVSVDRGGTLQPVNADLKCVTVDDHFLPTYGMSMAEGRNFSRNYGSDSANFLINETALSALGWKSPAEAMGKDIKYSNTRGKIIGVMKDIHFESLHERITPLILLYFGAHGNMGGRITVRVSGKDIPGAIAHIADTWKQFIPDKAFDYTFMDDNFAKLYKAETNQEAIFTLFSGIAIIIACLGLLGLSAFAISQRVKEIGIRRVLGAGTGSIVQLISGDFLKLVGIAACIAFPVAWYAMYKWLESFAYRTYLHWWVFLGAGIMALAVAFVTISALVIKAAATNPVKNLRSE
jgi:putative ABC transport system permease protein